MIGRCQVYRVPQLVLLRPRAEARRRAVGGGRIRVGNEIALEAATLVGAPEFEPRHRRRRKTEARSDVGAILAEVAFRTGQVAQKHRVTNLGGVAENTQLLGDKVPEADRV